MDIETIKAEITGALGKESKSSEVIEHVKIFKDLAKTLKENAQELIKLKSDAPSEADTKRAQEIISKSFASLIETRINHRNLYLEIEKNRIKTQTEKEKIDLLSNYLESLNYQKSNLIREIAACKNKEFSDLAKLPELHQKVKEMDETLTHENIGQRHTSLVMEFSEELENRKKVRTEFENKEQEKAQLIRKFDDDKGFLTKIPQHVQKIAEAAKPLQHLYKVGAFTTYEQISLAKELPHPLFVLHKKLVHIKESKVDEGIEIEVKDQGEALTKYGFNKLQLVLSIQKDKNDPSIKRYSELLGERTIFSGVYPLRVIFSYAPDYDLIVVSVESKTFFTVEDILSRLVSDDVGKKLYTNPKNENEKAVNNKFAIYPWIQELSKESLNIDLKEREQKILTVAEFIKKVRRRVEHKIILKHQMDYIRTNKTVSSKILNIFEIPEAPKTSFEILACNKISIDDYLKLLEIPGSLKESDNISNQLLKIPTLSEKIHEITNTKKQISNLEIYRKDTYSQGYKTFCHVNRYNKNEIVDEEFYRIELTHPKYRVTVLLVIGNDYPASPIQVVVKAYEEKPEPKKVPDEIMKRISQKALAKLNSEKARDVQVSSRSLDNIHREVNQAVELPDQNFEISYRILKLLKSLESNLGH